MLRRAIALPLLLVTSSGVPACGSDGLDVPACSEATLFRFTPVPLDTVAFVAPIGEMAPVGGSPLPKGHTGFALNAANVAVVSPGDLVITDIRETTYVVSPSRQGYSDYSVFYAVCDGVEGHFGHLASLAPEILAKASGAACQEYETVDETIRSCDVRTNIAVAAGAALGTAGTPPHSPSLDVGMTDSSVQNFVNPGRYDQKNAVCPWDHYESALRDSILDRVGDGITSITESPRCGAMAIDLDGTAQGRWTLKSAPADGGDPTAGDFFVLAPNPYAPESQVVISTRIGALDVATLPAFPVGGESGRVNPAASAITADGLIYCYVSDPATAAYSFLVQLGGDELRVEKRVHATGASPCAAAPETWTLSAAAVDLIR
ncbi:MAG: hypothetical protein R2939_10580 [Kofleriaceae bacterium]